MTDLLKIFLSKLKHQLDSAAFRTLSAHLLNSIELTTKTLQAQTCAENPDISPEIVMATLADAVINLLTRHQQPLTPNNVNAALSAAFSLAITQFYGDDTLKDSNANRVFLDYLGGSSKPLNKDVRSFCQALGHNIGLQRETDGELAVFPSADITTEDEHFLHAVYRFELSVLQFLSLQAKILVHLPEHITFVTQELPVAFNKVLQGVDVISLLNHASNHTLLDKFRALLVSHEEIDGCTELLHRLMRAYAEKIAACELDQLCNSPLFEWDILPDNKLADIVLDIFMEDEDEQILNTLFIEGKNAAFVKELKHYLYQHSVFLYLLFLKKIRANLHSQTIENYYPHAIKHQRQLISRVNCKRIAEELDYLQVSGEIKRFISPEAETMVDRSMLYANQRYASTILHVRLLMLGVLSTFSQSINADLLFAYNRVIATELLTLLRKHFIAQINDKQNNEDAELRTQTLIKLKSMKLDKFTVYLRKAFFQALSYHPSVGYELLVRRIICKTFHQPKDHADWPPQLQTMLLATLNDFYLQNPPKLGVASFIRTFDKYLRSPEPMEAFISNTDANEITTITDKLVAWHAVMNPPASQERHPMYAPRW